MNNMTFGEYQNFTDIVTNYRSYEYICTDEIFPVIPYTTDNFWQLLGMYFFIIEVLVFIL